MAFLQALGKVCIFLYRTIRDTLRNLQSVPSTKSKTPAATALPPGQVVKMLERLGQHGIEGTFRLFGILVEQLGFGGALLVASFWFINHNATADQKHRMIEMYVLGQGINLVWPVIVVFVGCVVVMLTQHHIYKVKQRILQNRIDELAQEKTRLQEEAIGRRLRHSDEPSAHQDVQGASIETSFSTKPKPVKEPGKKGKS